MDKIAEFGPTFEPWNSILRNTKC